MQDLKKLKMVVRAMGSLQDREDSALLRSVAFDKSKSENLRQVCIMALRDMRDPDAVSGLLKTLGEK